MLNNSCKNKAITAFNFSNKAQRQYKFKSCISKAPELFKFITIFNIWQTKWIIYTAVYGNASKHARECIRGCAISERMYRRAQSGPSMRISNHAHFGRVSAQVCITLLSAQTDPLLPHAHGKSFIYLPDYLPSKRIIAFALKNMRGKREIKSLTAGSSCLHRHLIQNIYVCDDFITFWFFFFT